MASNLETLIFEIIAKDKNASAAFDQFRRSVDGSTTSVDRNTGSLQKNQKAQVSLIGAAGGVALSLSAMATPLLAAGAGFTAFAGMAVPSVSKIKAAMTGPGGLAANLQTLDKGQQQVALSVQALGARYQGLAHAMEPQVFQTFNTGLKIANSLLGPTSQLAASAGKGIENFLAGFAADSGIAQFVHFLATQAGPAITLLGKDVTSAAHAVFTLLQSFGGLGMAELRAVTAVLTGLTTSVSWLATHTGPLAGIALGIGGIALALSKLGLLSSVLRLTGLSAAFSEIVQVTTGVKGLSLAERGLAASEALVNSVNPFAWAAAAVIGVGALAYALRNVQGGIEQTIAAMAKQDDASGLNVAGYQKLSQAAGDAAGRLAAVQSSTVLVGQAAGHALALQNAYSDAQRTAGDRARNLSADFVNLGQKYGLTTDQVKTLIVRSGSLNDILAANGRITPAVAEKIRAWAQTENKATGQTNAAAIAVQALTGAMDRNVTAVLTLQGDELAWRSAMQQASAQLASNSAGLKGNSANAIANKQAVLSTATAVTAFAKEQLTAKTNLGAAAREIQGEIRWLQGLHDKSGFAKTEIAALVGWLRQVKSEQVRLTVSGTGSWHVTTLPTGKQINNFAAGGRVPGFGGGDQWPALLEGGEAIVPKHLTPVLAPFLKAHGVPGFARGGVAGSYDDGVRGLTGWLKTENTATLQAMERSVADRILAAIRQGPPGGGFGGGGPGGGTPAMNARLAQLMMPAWSGGAAWAAWNYVAMRESGWNQFATNPTSGAYGIPQALPFSKMPKAAWPAWAGGSSNPAAQIGWMIGYIASRYGSPQNAAAHEMAFNWYDQGGVLPPGLSLAYNGTGSGERVGGGDTYITGPVTINMPVGSDGADVVRALQNYAKRNGPIRLKVRS